MSELEPLAQASENPRTRALLQAGRADSPPADFAGKLMLGLGVAGVTTSVSLGAAAGGGAAGAAKAGSGAAWLMAAKWVAVGMVGGGILASGASAVLAPTPVGSVAPLVQSTAPAPSRLPVRTSAPLAVAATPSAPAPLPEPAVAQPPGKPTESTHGVAPPSATSGQLGREVVQMDRARAAFAGGNATRCLAELDAFDGLAQTGVLDREARVLRIDALHQLGRNAEARALAQRYLQVYPRDAHAARLRAFVAEDR